MSLQIDRAQLLQMVEAGMSQKQIGARLGCCYESIRRALRKYGLRTLYAQQRSDVIAAQVMSRKRTRDASANCVSKRRCGVIFPSQEIPPGWESVTFEDVAPTVIAEEARNRRWWFMPQRWTWVPSASSCVLATAR